MITLNKIEKLNSTTVITIGNFDGIHIGHRKLIEKTKVMAEETAAKSLVFSFCPHTNQVLQDPGFKTIFTNDEKKFILENLGIDYLLEFPFNKINAKITCDEFLKSLIVNLNCRVLVLGSDYKFGSDNAKNVLEKYNDVIKIKKMPNILTTEKNKISSTYIRTLITEKNFAAVENFLATKYFVMSKILHGKKRGFIFPTINFILQKTKLLPPDGTYATTTVIKNKAYKSLTNIGYNPTVKNKFRGVETHILDFSKNVYGQTAIVYFENFIRNEIKFGSLQELEAQIRDDISQIT